MLAELPAAALGKQGVFGAQFHSGLVGGTLAAILEPSHVARGHAGDRTVVVVEDFAAGKAGVDFDSERFGLCAEPATEVAQADDVIAVIVGSIQVP